MSRDVLLGLLCATLAVAQSGSDNDILQRAVSLHQSGDYGGAISGYEQFLKAHPEAVGVRSNLGAALAHEGRFELKAGIAELELAEKLSSDSPQPRIALASAYAKVGRKEDAARERREFLRLKELYKNPGEQ